MFDSIINNAKEKFGLGDKAGGLVAALLGLMANPATGGFGGFIDRFREVGLGDKAESWISVGDNKPLTNEETESAFGDETIDSIAAQTGIDRAVATSALGAITPQVVDALTPDGEMPDEAGLLARIRGFLSDFGGSVSTAVLGGLGTAGAFVGDTVDRIDAAAGATYAKGREVFDGGIGAVSNVGDAFDDGDGILKWLIPLLLLGLLIILGYWFCGKEQKPVAPTNTNANKANANGNANANKANANGNANLTSNANANNAAPGGNKTLTEVVLPNGTKLQAFPGGIEDQLVKFIQSNEYKNGTAESLKNKWFDFDDLNFKFDSTELEASSQRQLDNIAAILKAFPDVKLKIGGYTDKKGDDAANKKLSDGRAKAVKAKLESAGVGAQVPEAEGYGEDQATVPETATDDERKVDRKTSVRLLK